MNHSAQHSQESAHNESGPGRDATPREPTERFPTRGHACPCNHHRADDKYEKQADRKSKNPRHCQFQSPSQNEIRLSRSCSSVTAAYICQSGDTFTFFSPRVRWPFLLVLFNSKGGCDFVAGTTRWIVFFLQSASALLTAARFLVSIEMMLPLSPLTFKPTTLQSSSLNKTDMS